MGHRHARLEATLRLFAGVVLVALATLAADRPLWAGDPLTKLGRGVTNFLTSPMEISTNMGKAVQKHGSFANGAFEGFFSGVFWMLARFTAGIYDIVTFPVPIPWNYEPVLKPPYAFDEWHATFPQLHQMKS